MSDKMMRVAGRDESGLAKGIKVKKDGRLEVDSTLKRNVFGQVTVPIFGEYESDILNTNGYSVGYLSLTTNRDTFIKITRVNYRRLGVDNYRELSRDEIYRADIEKPNHDIEYELKTPHYSLIVENLMGTAFIIDGSETQEILSSVKQKEEQHVNSILPDGRAHSLLSGASYETERLTSRDKNLANTTIYMLSDINIRVYLQEYRLSHSGYTALGYKEIYRSKTPSSVHAFDYHLNTNYHSLMIENIGDHNSSIAVESSEHLLKSTVPKKQKVEITNFDEGINVFKKGISDFKRNLKRPKTILKFKKSPIPMARAFVKLNDKQSLIITRDNLFSIYENVASDSPLLIESSDGWNTDNGRIANIRTTNDGGIVVFVNHADSGKARIYKKEDINSEPKLVYESTNTSGESRFSYYNGFGVKSYDNGLNTMILAGVYGRSAIHQDLILSTDDGETFNVIKQTANNSSENSHWHDVAFDIYHGYLWASEGDGEANQHVWWSDDMGNTWNAIQPEHSTQPTALIPFPDKLIMGRDSDNAGIDIVRKEDDYIFETLKEFKTSDTRAYEYYAKSPIVDGNEAYMSFDIFPDKEPKLLIATGDFGESWHFVHMSFGESINGTSITSFVDMDDEYVYAFAGGQVGASDVFYSERVKWE